MVDGNAPKGPDSENDVEVTDAGAGLREKRTLGCNETSAPNTAEVDNAPNGNSVMVNLVLGLLPSLGVAVTVTSVCVVSTPSAGGV
jgi:hypothetical protein